MIWFKTFLENRLKHSLKFILPSRPPNIVLKSYAIAFIFDKWLKQTHIVICRILDFLWLVISWDNGDTIVLQYLIVIVRDVLWRQILSPPTFLHILSLSPVACVLMLKSARYVDACTTWERERDVHITQQ